MTTGAADPPWGAGDDNPLGEGSDDNAATGMGLGDQRAGEDPAVRDGGRVEGKPGDQLAYDPDQEHEPAAGEQGGQPNLDPDPAVSGRPSRFGQGSTDDSPGTPSGL